MWRTQKNTVIESSQEESELEVHRQFTRRITSGLSTEIVDVDADVYLKQM